MLQKCANPGCRSPFRKLSEGKLFLVDRQDPASLNSSRGWGNGMAHRIEHFWLCSECASGLTLAFDAVKGLITVPLPERKKPAVGVKVPTATAESA